MLIKKTPRKWSEVSTGWEFNHLYVGLMLKWIYEASWINEIRFGLLLISENGVLLSLATCFWALESSPYPSPTTSTLWITILLFYIARFSWEKKDISGKRAYFPLWKWKRKHIHNLNMCRQIRWLLYFMTELLASYLLKSKRQKQNLSYNKPSIHKPPIPKRGRNTRTFKSSNV